MYQHWTTRRLQQHRSQAALISDSVIEDWFRTELEWLDGFVLPMVQTMRASNLLRVLLGPSQRESQRVGTQGTGHCQGSHGGEVIQLICQ
jgi:hypothetical protein